MSYSFFIGMDVGKYFHHATVLDADGNQIYSKRVEQSQKDLTSLFTRFHQEEGDTLVAVDQPNNIGRLTVETAKHCGCDVTYLPGLAMRNASRLYAGNAKTDIRDSFVIADMAHKMPSALRKVDHVTDLYAQLKVLNGIHEDHTRAMTKMLNEIRAALVGSYPQFERVLYGRILSRPWVLHLLATYGGPTKLARTGEKRVITFARKHGARDPEPLVKAMFEAIKAQTITVAGCKQIQLGVSQMATDCLAKLRHKEDIEKEVEAIASQLPLYDILLTMPGIGSKTAAAILMTVGDFSDFKTPAQLASYAGICPQTKQSGTSIHSQQVNHAGNKKLKNALWFSAFAAIEDHERSRNYYNRKREAGKLHSAAIMALARRRLNVLFAMVKNNEPYHENYNQTVSTT